MKFKAIPHKDCAVLRSQFCQYYTSLIGKTRFFVRLYNEELLTEAFTGAYGEP